MDVRIFFVTVLAASTPATAAPWSDWVGDYRGPLVWKQCTAAGEKTATLAIDAVDGALRIDLAPAGAALRAMSLAQEDEAWVAQDGDLHVRVTRKANAIDLAIDYDSGCTMRGKLVRASTKVVACDRLLGWARIEDLCTKPGDQLEDFAALARTKWRKADGARCRARADKLELAMIDRGCAPHADPDIGTRAVQCRALGDEEAPALRPRPAGERAASRQRGERALGRVAIGIEGGAPSCRAAMQGFARGSHDDRGPVAVSVVNAD